MNRHVMEYGDRALLVELDSIDDVLALHAALRADRIAGVVDLVPAARTVTVLLDPHVLPPETARTWIGRVGAGERDVHDERVVELEVDYAGEDLEEVARLTGMSVDDVIAAHSSSVWRVAFGGFAPGFGYLVTDHHRLDVPRRAVPRTAVPAGSVGLAGGFGGVYPRTGPGGWQIIGSTDAVLWDEKREPPALLSPGVTVRFRPAGRPSTGRGGGSSPERAGGSSTGRGGSGLSAVLSPSKGSERGGGLGSERGTSPRVETPGLDTLAGARYSTGEGGRPAGEEGRSTGEADAPALTIVEPGMQALIEDLGRPGNASIGAARSGALDRAALRLGNRLLGNDESAAALEILYGGASVRFEHPMWFAVTGARGPLVLSPAETGGAARSRLVEPDVPTRADAGDTLSIGRADAGIRYVLAVRGGVQARPVLGSCSRDVGAGIGPDALTAGVTLAVGPPPAVGIPPVDALIVPPPPTDTVVVHVRPGPRADWFAPAAITRFYETEWRVSAESNRIGLRLSPPDGFGDRPALTRAIADELPSEAMVPGAIQVPPNGAPVVLLADHPVTGGYPVIAVVSDADLDLFAQLRPGQGVRFRHGH